MPLIIPNRNPDFTIHGSYFILSFFITERLLKVKRLRANTKSFYHLKPTQDDKTLKYSVRGSIYMELDFPDPAFPDLPGLVEDAYKHYKTYYKKSSPGTVTGTVTGRVSSTDSHTHTVSKTINSDSECDCGAKHTSNPCHHANWCSALNRR